MALGIIMLGGPYLALPAHVPRCVYVCVLACQAEVSACALLFVSSRIMLLATKQVRLVGFGWI